MTSHFVLIERLSSLGCFSTTYFILFFYQRFYCIHNDFFQLSEFLKPLDSVPRSKRGWYFGAQLTGRPSLVGNSSGPAPADYQTVSLSPSWDQSKAAFNSVSPRWIERDRDSREPGSVYFDIHLYYSWLFHKF